MKKVGISSIDTLILCGGKGTRLQSIVPDKPKILADIGGAPFIKYLFNYLEIKGIKRIILCTGYMHDQIEEWVKSSYHGNLDILFSREKRSLGTAGATKNAAKYLQSEHFFVLNGDTFTKVNYIDLMGFFFQKKALGAISVVRKPKSDRYGRISMDKHNKITSFNEKISDGKGLINAGVYIFPIEIIELIPNNQFSSFDDDIFPLLVKYKDKGLYGFFINEFFIDIGTPSSYQKANKCLIDL